MRTQFHEEGIDDHTYFSKGLIPSKEKMEERKKKAVEGTDLTVAVFNAELRKKIPV